METNHVLDLLSYLEAHCDGDDQYVFWTDDAQPDIGRARDFAEELREQLGGFLGTFATVEQRVNVVHLHLVEEPASLTA